MTSTLRNTAFGFICAVPAAMLPVSSLAYEEMEIADGAVIEGRVTYQGRIPSRRIVPTSDREICGGIREWQLVERDADNGIRNAMVYLEAVERGKPWAETQLEVPVMDNLDCMFEPHILVMQPGEIDIHNSDDVLHNTKAYYGRRAVFNLALPEAGMTIRRELNRPGVVRFECDAHGWMEGWAYVLPHPYYALTAADGTFRIDDLPPGEYTLIARHEHIGEVQQTLNVGPGETAQISIELTQ